MDWSVIRAQFPALKGRAYLNTATYGQAALRVQQAVTGHFERRDTHACTDFLSWFDDMNSIRASIGRLIGADADDIAFISTAAAALSLFMSGIEWKPGDRILTLRDEFPNQYYYAKWLSHRGTELIEVPEIESIPAGTRAVAVSTVNYTTGYRPDIAQIAGMAHDAGALLYVDATQSLGALRFSVAECMPDMMACDPYKWLLSPNGASFFYISPELRRTLTPSVFGWRSDKNWRNVDNLSHGVPELPDAAERYEGAMLNFPSLYGLGESLNMLRELGMETIEQRVLHLNARVAEAVSSLGGTVVHRNTNVTAARLPVADVSALARRLADAGVIVAARHGNLRISPHFYNDEADIETLTAATRDYLRASKQ